MKPQRLTTQKISPALAAAAAEALGGPPARPPLPTAPVSRPVNPAHAAAKEAFTKASTVPESAATIGNPTFDAIPPELVQRRAKVATVRGRLSGLASLIRSEHAELGAIIADLADDAGELKRGELFDCDVAATFLADLKAVVDGLAPKASAEKPDATAQDIAE